MARQFVLVWTTMVTHNYKPSVRKMIVKGDSPLSVEGGDIPLLPGVQAMIAIPTDKEGHFDLGSIVVYKNG